MADREKLLDRITLRLDEQLMAEVDRYAERAAARAGGVRISRTELLRHLIERGLRGLEGGGDT